MARKSLRSFAGVVATGELMLMAASKHWAVSGSFRVELFMDYLFLSPLKELDHHQRELVLMAKAQYDFEDVHVSLATMCEEARIPTLAREPCCGAYAGKHEDGDAKVGEARGSLFARVVSRQHLNAWLCLDAKDL